MGYKLIHSGVKGDFKFSTKIAGVKADLASVSPGLLFVLLGVMLIGYAMYVEKTVELKSSNNPRPEMIIPDDLFMDEETDSLELGE